MPLKPNISKLINSEVIGQLVTPQNTLVMPTAVQSTGEKPVIVPNRQPNVAPIKNVGTISPPLNQAPKGSAVNSIFNKNAAGTTSPFKAREMTCIPVPL